MFVLCQSILLGPSKRLEPEKVVKNAVFRRWQDATAMF